MDKTVLNTHVAFHDVTDQEQCQPGDAASHHGSYAFAMQYILPAEQAPYQQKCRQYDGRFVAEEGESISPYDADNGQGGLFRRAWF